MADIQNPSFELPDQNPGEAQYWDEAYDQTGEDVGPFWNGERYVPFEGFEGYNDSHLGQSTFIASNFEVGGFNGGAATEESMEYGWASPLTGPPFNHQGENEFIPSLHQIGLFDSGSEQFEDMENDWSNNQDSVADLDSGTSAVGQFDVANDDFEDFEEEWFSNENAVANFDAGTKTFGLFDSGTQGFEDFENNWTTTLP